MLSKNGNNLLMSPTDSTGTDVGKLIGDTLPVNLERTNRIQVSLFDESGKMKVDYEFVRMYMGKYALAAVSLGNAAYNDDVFVQEESK